MWLSRPMGHPRSPDLASPLRHLLGKPHALVATERPSERPSRWIRFGHPSPGPSVGNWFPTPHTKAGLPPRKSLPDLQAPRGPGCLGEDSDPRAPTPCRPAAAVLGAESEPGGGAGAVDLPADPPGAISDSSGIRCPRGWLPVSGQCGGQAESVGVHTSKRDPHSGGSCKCVPRHVSRSSAKLSPAAQGGHFSLTRPCCPSSPLPPHLPLTPVSRPAPCRTCWHHLQQTVCPKPLSRGLLQGPRTAPPLMAALMPGPG